MFLTHTTLRWACLARNGGNLNTGCSHRSRGLVYTSGDEALKKLYFRGEFYRS